MTEEQNKLAEEMEAWLHSREHPYRTVKLMTDAIAALRREPATDAVLVPIATLDRIMRDCEHGSRIWKECDALAREYRLSALKGKGASQDEDAKR